jgi:hypothetical protein
VLQIFVRLSERLSALDRSGANVLEHFIEDVVQGSRDVPIMGVLALLKFLANGLRVPHKHSYVSRGQK